MPLFPKKDRWGSTNETQDPLLSIRHGKPEKFSLLSWLLSHLFLTRGRTQNRVFDLNNLTVNSFFEKLQKIPLRRERERICIILIQKRSEDLAKELETILETNSPLAVEWIKKVEEIFQYFRTLQEKLFEAEGGYTAQVRTLLPHATWNGSSLKPQEEPQKPFSFLFLQYIHNTLSFFLREKKAHPGKSIPSSRRIFLTTLLEKTFTDPTFATCIRHLELLHLPELSLLLHEKGLEDVTTLLTSECEDAKILNPFSRALRQLEGFIHTAKQLGFEVNTSDLRMGLFYAFFKNRVQETFTLILRYPTTFLILSDLAYCMQQLDNWKVLQASSSSHTKNLLNHFLFKKLKSDLEDSAYRTEEILRMSYLIRYLASDLLSRWIDLSGLSCIPQYIITHPESISAFVKTLLYPPLRHSVFLQNGLKEHPRRQTGVNLNRLYSLSLTLSEKEQHIWDETVRPILSTQIAPNVLKEYHKALAYALLFDVPQNPEDLRGGIEQMQRLFGKRATRFFYVMIEDARFSSQLRRGGGSTVLVRPQEDPRKGGGKRLVSSSKCLLNGSNSCSFTRVVSSCTFTD